MGVNAMTPEPPGGAPSLGPNDAMSPWKPSQLAQTVNGTALSAKIDESTYFTYTSDFTSCADSGNHCGLKSGDRLAFGITRLGGQEAAGSAYTDGWRPAGAGSVMSVLPQANLYSLPDPNGVRIYEGAGTGTLSFDGSNVPQAELPRSASKTTTYFTTYDQATGIYFEYFAGSSLPSNDARFGRVNRRYDTKGNVIQYNYANNGSGKALLRSLSGDIAGGVVPYFFYADETIDATHSAPVTKLALIDTAAPANTRTLYFEYQNYSDGTNTYPYLSKVINPTGSVQRYDPVIPFNTSGGDTTDAFQIKREVDADGYATYFAYGGTALTQAAEPEGRIVYYEYTPTGETRQVPTGRPRRTMVYAASTFGGHLPLVTKDVDSLGNTTYYGYNNLSLARMSQSIQPNGNLTYYQYLNSGQNKYAQSLQVSAFNNAVTYFGYSADAYDLVKRVGPRFVAGTTIDVTYFTYDAARNRTAVIDALGNQTLYGRDALGRSIRRLDARGNPTYFNFSATSGSLDSQSDALSNVSYFGYNAFLNRTADVSPRWAEQGGFQAFTTYHVYDPLNRRIRTIDPQSGVTYFNYSGRGDLLSQVDAAGGAVASTYDGLRLRTQTTFTDRSGAVLVQTKDGYDLYKNRVRSLDGRGNAAYYFYDHADRLSARKDALANSSYFFYDAVGRMTAWGDERNNTTYLFYDLLSRKSAKRDALANAAYYFYDLGNKLAAQLDVRGNPSYFFYDAVGRQSATRDALGNPVYYFYDSVSNESVVTNSRFASTYYGYDGLNRRVRSQDALGNSTYFAYDARGNGTRVTNARSYTTTTTYDTLDRRVVRTNALSNPTYFGYDAVGNRVRWMNARFAASYYFYDGMRRATAARNSVGAVSYFFYDPAGNRSVRTNARAAATYFGYDSLNRRSAIRDALANTTYYFYDAVGNRTRLQNARLFSSTFAFDPLNRKTTVQDALGNSSYFVYSATGYKVRVINARSHAWTAAFDAVDRVIAQADALSNTTYYFYDPVGNATVILNPRFKAAYFAYDAVNRLTTIQDALANVTYFVYDAVGNITSRRNARGAVAVTTYDALNRPSAVGDANGNLPFFWYDQVGNLSAIDRGGQGYGIQAYGTSPYGGLRGAVTYFAYDSLNRRTATLDALLGAAYFYYDLVGNLTGVRNPLNHVGYFSYDLLNRLTQAKDALGGATDYAYDAVGNLTSVTDADAHQAMCRYDALNRVDAQRYADTASAYFFYDPVGNRANDLDPLGNATYFGYDSINRLARVQDALGRSVYFEYDQASNLSKAIDAENATASLTYDAVNRRTNAAYAAAGAVISEGLGLAPYYIYDAVGNVTQVGDLWGLHRMAYDPGNRLVTHQFPYAQVVYFRYDFRSNVTARVYPSTAGTQGADYDALDRQTRVQAPSGATAYFVYDQAGNLTKRILGDGVTLDAAYDQAERIDTWKYSKSSAAPLTYFSYTKDAKGLVTKAVREATYTVYYAYDACDRLTMEVWASGVTEVYGYRYAYDLAGNRTKARVNGSDTYYQYDRANQLTQKGTNALFANPTTFTYDRNGSLITQVKGAQTTKFAYNPAGLVSRILWNDATSTYFSYDGNLRRYSQRQAGTLTYFLWDGPDLLQTLNADGTVKEEYTQAASPTPGVGQLVETNRPGVVPQKIYPVMDPRGTITKYLQTDGTTVVASREYDAFGNLIPNSSVGTWPGSFGYQGQAWTEVTSGDGTQRLLVSPTRLYDPVDGRYLSRDLAATADPNDRIQSYQYARQSPTLFGDPLGQSASLLGVAWNSVRPRYEIPDPASGWYQNDMKVLLQLQKARLFTGSWDPNLVTIPVAFEAKAPPAARANFMGLWNAIGWGSAAGFTTLHTVAPPLPEVLPPPAVVPPAVEPTPVEVPPVEPTPVETPPTTEPPTTEPPAPEPAPAPVTSPEVLPDDAFSEKLTPVQDEKGDKAISQPVSKNTPVPGTTTGEWIISGTVYALMTAGKPQVSGIFSIGNAGKYEMSAIGGGGGYALKLDLKDADDKAVTFLTYGRGTDNATMEYGNFGNVPGAISTGASDLQVKGKLSQGVRWDGQQTAYDVVRPTDQAAFIRKFTGQMTGQCSPKGDLAEDKVIKLTISATIGGLNISTA